MSAPSTPMVLRLLAEQRKRCLATILTNAEASTWWTSLDTAEQQTFRDQVRSALGSFYDLARDIVKVSEEDTTGAMQNELALDLIRSIHAQQQVLAQHITRS